MKQYRETRIEGRRHFELRDDGVKVKADLALGPSIETFIRFDQLDPSITVIRMRHSLFWRSMMGIPMFATATILSVSLLRLSPFGFFFTIMLGGLVVSAAVAVLTRHRIEYARFCSPTGVALLDIARSGPDREHFDRFVATVEDRIKSANNSTTIFAREPAVFDGTKSC